MQIEDLDDRHYALRLPLITVGGFIAALFLTWFMYALIQSTHPNLDESERVHLLDFVRVKKTEQSQRADRKPQRPQQAPEPPAPVSQSSSNSDAGDGGLVIEMPSASDLNGLNGLAIGAGEGEYLPLIKVAPVYPPRALQTGLESYCVVVYTVTKSGSVRDVEVDKNACPERIFERPSVKAAQKFKYKPRIINGEPVEIHGVRNRFTYTIAENAREKYE